MKGEGEESSSDLHLPLPCNPAQLWSFPPRHVTSLPSQGFLRPKVRVRAADLRIVPHTVHSQPWGGRRSEGSWCTAVPLRLPGPAGRPGAPNGLPPRGVWYSPNPRPETSAVSFGSQGSPSGAFLVGGLVGKTSWLLRRWHYRAEAQGRSGTLLCVCSGVPGGQLWGGGGRAAPLERGTVTCDILPLLWLTCVS